MSRWTVADIPSQQGKVAVVTGASSGLGLETASALAGAGAQVVMACRTPARAEPALAQVRAQHPQAQVELMPLDLASLDSVRAFAEAFNARFGKLDLLCNNAGVMALPLERTVDGFEMQIGTNHLGHFALTGLLLDRLRAAPAARVVSVASLAHRAAKDFDVDDLNWERGRYNDWDAYGRSKLANLLFTFELDRRLKRQGLSAVAAAAHPGYAATNLGFNGTAFTRTAVGRLVMHVGNTLLAQPAEMGALPQLYALTANDVRGGEYYGPRGLMQFRGYPTVVDCRPKARDPQLAAQLWTRSQELTGVRYL
jgi:NAD(P)-dependent dehydrogenase (short-subunit alcohol dehydrogenase family)